MSRQANRDLKRCRLQRDDGSLTNPFETGAVKVVSDAANEDLPLDFNQFRDPDGRFQARRIAATALLHPFSTMPALLRLDRNCRRASENLGEFFADCEF